jgi:hypothetical protein
MKEALVRRALKKQESLAARIRDLSCVVSRDDREHAARIVECEHDGIEHHLLDPEGRVDFCPRCGWCVRLVGEE